MVPIEGLADPIDLHRPHIGTMKSDMGRIVRIEVWRIVTGLYTD